MGLRSLYDLPAPAKLNHFLHVVGRRADGYHLLESVFVLIDWADRLHVERRDDARLVRHDLGTPLPQDDLCLRAARALQSASGCALGADIHVDKQLPAGAGMGGGSSDAATTLLALNRLWGLGWSRQRLAGLALALGADVPFFIHGRNAFVHGIGEHSVPLVLPAAHYAVVKPAPGIPTAAIFGHPQLRRNTEPVIVAGSFEDGDGTGRPAVDPATAAGPQPVVPSGFEAVRERVCEAGFGRNDLQPIAEIHEPEVAAVARWLQARFGNSRMTGSGSAVFARVAGDDPVSGAGASPEAMSGQQNPLGGLPHGWVGRMCRSLAQHPLLGWAD